MRRSGRKGRAGVWLATAATLVLPLLFLLSTKEKSYLVAWPIFGSSNQLLAALTLLAETARVLRRRSG